MKRLTGLFLLSCAIFAASCSSAQKKEPVKLKTFQDSVSWALGEDIMLSFIQTGVELNAEILSKAIKHTADNEGALLFTKEERLAILTKLQEMKLQEQAEQLDSIVVVNREASKKYMVELIAKDPSIKSTPSGLYYKILKQGKGGKHPSVKGRASMNYKGILMDGTVFDNSFTRKIPVLLGVANAIPGIVEGLSLMQEGAHYMLYVPDHLAYGTKGNADIGVQPGMLIVYEIELYKVMD